MFADASSAPLVLVIHLNEVHSREEVSFLGRTLILERRGCGGEVARAQQLIAEFNGRAAAIALEGLPALLELGQEQRRHEGGAFLAGAAAETPVVDGRGVRPALERWGVILADQAQPGIFSHKRILMTPGLNHGGLAQALGRHSTDIRYADPVIYFALPDFPGVGSRFTLQQAAGPTLDQLKDEPYRRILPQAGQPGTPRAAEPFLWADVLAGDISVILRYAPADLRRKTVVVEWATEEELAALRDRGAAIAVTMMPSLVEEGGLGRWSAAALEGALVALRPDPGAPLTEDTYLDLLAGIHWQPAIHYLQPEEAAVNRFAFVIHPLSVSFIHKHKLFRWTRYLPNELVERVAAYMPPSICRVSPVGSHRQPGSASKGT